MMASQPAPATNPFFPDVTRPLRFPRDLLRIVYWAYFRPFTLERYLKQRDPTLDLESSLLTLSRKDREHPELRHLVYLTLFHALVTPWLAFPLVGFLSSLGVPVDWTGVLWGVLVGVLVGVLGGVLVGVLWGVLVGVLWGVLVGVLWGVLVGVLGGVLLFVLLFVLWFVLWFVLVGVLGVVSEVVSVRVREVVLGFVLMGVLRGVSEGVLGGVLWGVLGGVLGGMYFRLHDWLLLLLPGQAWALARLDRTGRWVRLSPPFWHEVVVLPLPGVEEHVYRLARHDRAMGQAAVEYLAAYRYAWARKVAARVALRLLLDDLARARTLDDLAHVYEAMQPWLLPSVRAQWEGILGPVETIAGKVRAGLESGTPANRATRWQEALEALQSFRQALHLGGAPFAPNLLPVLDNWEPLLRAAVEQARKQVFIDNPYVVGTALQTAAATFKGRQDIMHRLEAEFVAFQTQRPALLLFGGRRMGKTSLLKQLPARLGPEVVPLVLDMQALSAVESPAALWRRLMARSQEQARRFRGVDLPPGDEKALAQDPFDAFLAWLDQVERAATRTYFLLALDEYGKIEEAIQQGRLDLRVLDLLRHILQHRRRWLVLFSGVHTFEDLPVHWSDRFINVRRLLVGPLEEDAARELVLRPIPGFEQQVHHTEATVARLLHATGRQPNWLQAALKELIQRLNEERRRAVTLEDVDWALARVPQVVPGDFQVLWAEPQPFPQRLNDPRVLEVYQRVLYHLAAAPGATEAALRQAVPEEGARLVRPILRFFVARQMLVREDDGYRWAFPLLERWLRERGE